jgi:copper oxidase (laccase) domain-containing protein
VAGVARAAVEALCAAGAERGKLRAALGPSICRKCFEVGEEVALKFEHLEGAVVRAPGRKPHVDLHAANALQLHEAGIPLDQIDAAPPCSMCDGARFFSFRRDGARIGQMLSWVVAG